MIIRIHLMRSLPVIFLLSFIALTTRAQSKWVFENYNYIQQKDAAVFVPMLHFETKNNWYAEVRYNYEDVKTISLFGGKMLSGGRSLSYTLIPMIGFSAGNFTGVSLAANADLEWRNFFFSSQSQFSKATKNTSTDFFFNWSELGYSIGNHLFAGVAMQYTAEPGAQYLEPGLLAGFCFKNVSVPFYAFSPFAKDRYFVLGLNVEYNLKKRKN
jgi:hypothetical protein